MPVEPSTIAAVAGQGVGDAVNAVSTLLTNRQNQKWSEKQYDKQYKNALEFWNMQNAYNSPQAQMQRYQQAGLNPHLVYGAGNPGNAGAISTPDVQPVQARSPEFGNSISRIGALADLEIKQAQIDNLRTQNTVLQEEALLKAAQTKSVSTGEESTRFKLGFEQELRDISADARKEQLRQTRVRTDLSLNQDSRAAIQTATNVQEAAERIKNMQQQRLSMAQQRAQSRAEVDRIQADIKRLEATYQNALRDGTLKDLEIALRKDGITFQDPLWSRMLAKTLENLFGGSLFENIQEAGKKLFNPDFDRLGKDSW